MSDTVRAVGFYAVAFGLSVLVLAASPWLGEASPLVTMTTPAVAVLVMMVVTGEGASRHGWKTLGFHRAGWGYWPYAAGLPVAILLAAYAITWMLGFGRFTVPEVSGGVAAAAARIAVGFGITLVLSMGEEIGWRGYMLPRLLKRLGVLPAMLAVGFLHGLWHMPLMLGTTYYHNAGNPLIVVPLFLLALTLAGVAFGWLRLFSGSVWPVAVAHAVWNMAWELLSEMTDGEPDALEYLAGESGILPIAGLAIVAALLARRMSARPAVQPAA